MRDRDDRPDVVVYGQVEHSTTRAILFKGTGWSKPMWLPRSQIEISEVDEGEFQVAIRAWLAEKSNIREDTG